MSERADLLVEIGTEELPPKSLRALSAAMRAGMLQGLEAASLAHGEVRSFATPRRLALVVEQLARTQPDREMELRGPPQRVAFDADGEPTRAALAFADKCGVGVAELQRVETDKGTWLTHRRVEAGRDAAQLLPGIVNEALAKLPVPRPMRWGNHDIAFVRPAHWVVMLLGDEPVAGSVLGIAAGRATRGHRFHCGAAITVAHPARYEAQLETEGRVIADFDTRRMRVTAGVESEAARLGGTPVGDDALFDEVTALVEWPVAIGASFDARFLELPPEVLIETLQAHQRYFPVRGHDGALTRHFVTVANIDSKQPELVRTGNERVVAPRLADAEFFYKSDRCAPLASRLAALAGVVFQRKLGTLHDKMRRVEGISVWLAEHTGGDAANARRAAQLAKCDLLTDMVGEFPSLQGTMGRYYALHDGEPETVANALEEQYLPRFAGDRLPATETGRVLAVAEKIDTIAGIFAIGQRPTGTRDPFALRRSALGVLRILIEQNVDVDLRALIVTAVGLQPVGSDNEILHDEIYQYFLDRLRAWYLDGEIAGITPQVFDAVATRAPERMPDFHARVLAVRDFAALPEAASLSAANKRIANILRGAGDEVAADVDPAALTEPAERELHAAVTSAQDQALPLLEQRRYGEALTRLARLRPAVDRFFDDVMVMTEDTRLRRNRLALLGQLRELFLRTADLSYLQSG